MALPMLLALSMLLVACVPALRAQGPVDAAVLGSLRDEGGLPLGAAEVRLSSSDAGNVSYARTDAQGEFAVLGLPPGSYRCAVALRGSFVWVGAAVVTVEAGESRALPLRLGHEATGLRLSVAATGAPAEAATGDAVALPVPDRDWEAAEATDPATHDATLAGGGSAQDATSDEDTAAARSERETGSPATGLSFAGLPVTQNAQTTDGLSSDQGFRNGPRGSASGGPRLGSGFAGSALHSVRVLPSTFSAQYGGGAGGVVAVASRASENGFHGNLFFQARESAWAAVNPFAVETRYADGVVNSAWVRPDDSDLQYGGGIGVPLVVPGLRRLRLGVFGSIEAQRRDQSLVSSPQTPTFFSLTETQVALLGNRGVGEAARHAALDALSGLMGTTDVFTSRTLGFGRLDAAPGAHDRLSATYALERGASPFGGVGRSADAVVNQAIPDIGRSNVAVDARTGRWQHVFGSRVENEVRFGLVHDLEFEVAGTPSAGEAAIGPGGYAPQVAIAPEGFRYGTPASLGRLAYPDERRLEVADTFAWRFGHHLLTAGGDWSRLDERILAATNLEGAFLYDSGNTGGFAGGLVDWITDFTFNVHAYPNGGCPSINAKVHDFCFRSYTQSFQSGATQFVTHDVAGFAEDAFRVRSDLLLSVGVRYDYTLLPFPQTPNAALDLALAGVTGYPAASTASFPEDRNNVGPRASLVWAPGGGGRRHGRWFSVHFGYGMFYGRLPGATINAALADTALPNSITSIRILPTVETACPQVANQGFGYPCSFLSAPPGVVAQTTSAVLFARGFRMPAVGRGTLGLERDFRRRVTVRGAYATAWATQLPETTDLNIAPSTEKANYVLQGGDGRPGLYTGQAFSVPLYTARRSTHFGPVSVMLSNANATYHSGTGEVRVQALHGLSLRASYTFARAIDYGPQLSPAPRQDGQFDPFTDGYDKGLSSLQFAHHVAGDLIYRTDLHEGPAALRYLLSGWQLAGIGTAGSGAPYSYTIFGGTRLSGGRESINGSGGATYLPTVGRNTLRLPPRSKLDLRGSRELPFGGRRRLEVRGDVFNVLNTVSVSRVETRAFLLGTPATTGAPTPLVFQDARTVAAEGLTTPAFGSALSSTGGLSRERQIELGVRLHF